MHRTPRLPAALRAAIAAALLMAAALPAGAQMITDAMIQQQMAAMNALIARGQQGVNSVVQQRMRDPQVQAAWQRYVAQSGGRPAMDYPGFTYWYVYTNGFSAQGVAHARANEAGIQQREAAAVAGLRDAERQRSAAQQGQRDAYAANQQEAGRMLRGENTWFAPDGTRLVLPHTWAANTMHRHEGRTYGVDAGGRYHVLGADGLWYPLAAR